VVLCGIGFLVSQAVFLVGIQVFDNVVDQCLDGAFAKRTVGRHIDPLTNAHKAKGMEAISDKGAIGEAL
jgi:hypothetical protein